MKGITSGEVVITCLGKEPIKFRQGTSLQSVLERAAIKFGAGSFVDSAGYEVTQDSPDLDGGQYSYQLAVAGM